MHEKYFLQKKEPLSNAANEGLAVEEHQKH